MAKLLGRFDQVVAEVMQHPKRTLRMKVSRVELDESGTATLDFELVGGGTEAVDIVNPATLAQGAGLSLQGWPDKPPDEFQAGEVFGFSIDEITEVKKPEGVIPETLIQIAPGEVRSFHAGVGLPVPAPQTYLIQLVYQNATEFPEKPAVMIGELFSKRIKIDVPAPKK
jgi:hypothetical protein